MTQPGEDFSERQHRSRLVVLRCGGAVLVGPPLTGQICSSDSCRMTQGGRSSPRPILEN